MLIAPLPERNERSSFSKLCFCSFMVFDAPESAFRAIQASASCFEKFHLSNRNLSSPQTSLILSVKSCPFSPIPFSTNELMPPSKLLSGSLVPCEWTREPQQVEAASQR